MYSYLWSVAAFLSLGFAASVRGVEKRAVPPGFATTKGTQFEVDGKPFVRFIIKLISFLRLDLFFLHRTLSELTLMFVHHELIISQAFLSKKLVAPTSDDRR